MQISMYQASVPAFVQTLNAMSAILDKAEAFAKAKKIDQSVLAGARLAPDMFPLSRQIQIACDFAKGASARLAGLDVPSWPDTESSIAELKARIAKTIDFIEQIKQEQIDGSETRDVTIKISGKPVTFAGLPYLVSFVLPNYYFHLVAAYAILRHNGVELGKGDFLAGIPQLSA